MRQRSRNESLRMFITFAGINSRDSIRRNILFKSHIGGSQWYSRKNRDDTREMEMLQGMRSTTKEQPIPTTTKVALSCRHIRYGASAWRSRNAHNSNSSQRVNSRNGCTARVTEIPARIVSWTSVWHSDPLPSSPDKCNPLTDHSEQLHERCGVITPFVRRALK